MVRSERWTEEELDRGNDLNTELYLKFSIKLNNESNVIT